MTNKHELTNVERVGSVDVYQSPIMELADEYINNHGLEDPEKVNKSFLDMVNYITARYRADLDNVPELENAFDCFCTLCERYNYIPTMQIFSRFVKEEKSISKYDNMQERLLKVNQGVKKATPEQRAFIKKAMKVCKDSLVNTVTQSRGADVNRIFILKAVHGMSETQPQTVDEVQRQSTGELLGDMGLGLPG